MTGNMVHHREHNKGWIIGGAVLALLGLASVIISFIVGNTWNEDGGTSHGAIQAALLIPGAIAVGVGLVLVAIGIIKRRPKHGEEAGVTRR